ncbi:MAG: protein phosphatase 2C domain-containing protein [Chloroflexi bacterium]|nr:protein phosphatase 2C domain-containing protein [Chloroflexota bacterium]
METEQPAAGGGTETAATETAEPTSGAPIEPLLQRDAPSTAELPGADAPMPAVEEPSIEAPTAVDALEELILPSLVQPPEVLSPGAIVGPDGRLRIVEHLGTRGRINRYAATWQDEAGQPIQVELREGPADHAGLQREAEVLAAVPYAMLPRAYAAFEQEGRRYLALDRVDGETLELALLAGLDADRALSIVLQLVQLVRRLHRDGWALIGLAPADVCLGQPLRLTQLGHAARIGEPLPGALHVPGYSAPELANAGVVTGKEDVYTLGAILYQALAGQPLAESGAELAALPTAMQTPGGPQLLAGALAPTDERIDIEALYRAILALRQRLAERPIALEVASATSVGLNPTRPVNEDSCGYVVWSMAVAEGIIYRALLCVADGMGGMDAGEVASRTALNAVMSAAAGPLPLPPPESGGDPPAQVSARPDPVALIRQAAPAVYAAARGRQMGTTMTCVVVEGGELTLGHVGDTRAYLLRDGGLTQITADHSLVAAMVASGMLTAEEARGHPDSNKVLRSLGGQRELPDGYVDSLEAALGQSSLQLQSGDWIVLCSDGVWGSVQDAEIQAIVVAAADCPTVARVLVERALEAGAPDNAATVVARCVRMPAA